MLQFLDGIINKSGIIFEKCAIDANIAVLRGTDRFFYIFDEDTAIDVVDIKSFHDVDFDNTASTQQPNLVDVNSKSFIYFVNKNVGSVTLKASTDSTKNYLLTADIVLKQYGVVRAVNVLGKFYFDSSVSALGDLAVAVAAAQDTANDALTQAGIANTAAGNAQTTANNAVTAAGVANSAASTAQSTADTANTKADNALGQLASIQTNKIPVEDVNGVLLGYLLP